MRGLGLCVLALLCLQTVCGQHADVLIFCDDPSVEKAVIAALNTFNKAMSTGHKLALFQVTFASKSENGSYLVQFTTRRSDCPASDAKPWTECVYLPSDTKPIPCNATVHINETDTDTRHVECQIERLVLSGKVHCLGCPEDISENSEDLKVPLSVSISKYNTISNHTHLFTLHEVGPATRQIVAGFRYKLKFDMRRTNCAKAEHKELHELCEADPDNVEFANCNSTVDMAPWRLEAPDAEIKCESGLMPTVLVRRRPPGWSPLRNFVFEQTTRSPQPPPTPKPKKKKSSKGSTKDESSEEDTGLVKSILSPDASPFHCPSKPWKTFVLVHAGSAPTKATPIEPTAGGSFSDFDLVG